MESRIDLEKGTIAQISKEPDYERWFLAKKACTVVCFICICIIVSFFTSVVTSKVLLTPTTPNEAQISGDCITCDEETVMGANNEGAKCCKGKNLPVSTLFLQTGTLEKLPTLPAGT